jgi:plasmid stability protein
MSQLLVRGIEPSIIKKLRSSASAQGVSVEEAHRRLLRSALAKDQLGPQKNFIEYLRSIPKEEAVDFPRSVDMPRSVSL